MQKITLLHLPHLIFRCLLPFLDEITTERLRAVCTHLRKTICLPAGFYPLASSHCVQMTRVSINGLLLENVIGPSRMSFIVNLRAICMNPVALVHVQGDLRYNYNLNFMAVSVDGRALEHVRGELRRDFYLNLAAVQQNGLALEFVKGSLRHNHALNLAAVKQNGRALQFVTQRYLFLNIVAVLETVQAYVHVHDNIRDHLENNLMTYLRYREGLLSFADTLQAYYLFEYRIGHQLTRFLLSLYCQISDILLRTLTSVKKMKTVAKTVGAHKLFYTGTATFLCCFGALYLVNFWNVNTIS